MWGLYARAFTAYGAFVGFAFMAAIGIAVLANILQFGFLFTLQKLKPKFTWMNPIPGSVRLFYRLQALVQLGWQLAKISLVFIVVYVQLHDQVPLFYQLAHASPSDILLSIEGMAYGIGIRFGILFFCLGMLDYFWEKRQLAQSLKMTKTEVKVTKAIASKRATH